MAKAVEEFLIQKNLTVKEAMRRMGQVGEKILFVVDGRNRLLGSLSDGDIRRWVLRDGGLTAEIGKVYNESPVFVTEPYDVEEAKRLMIRKKIEWVPVVRDGGVISEVLLWDTLFGKEVAAPKEKISIPVVIMAGGKGTRLDPFTKILPKPLIPIGEKPIIEIIMDKFHQYGINEFFISVHHRSRMIKAYFEERPIRYKIHYIEEEEPLGTAGSLRFFYDKVKGSIFVSNCDIIIESDYHEMVEFHESKKYDITMVGSFRHLTLPYGICFIENGGTLTRIEEKPEYDYLVNTGMYLIKREVLELISENQPTAITDLIQKVREKGGRVGVFPIDEKSWIDVGQWEEYRRAKRILEAD